MSKESSWKRFWEGVRNEVPLLIGVAPFGMIYGVIALEAGLSPLQAQAMSVVVFAGSAQFMTVQLLAGMTPALVVILTGFVVNLRHLLYSASVAPWLQGLSSFWKALLAYLLTDEAYAVSIVNYRHNGQRLGEHWFFLGAGLALWATWQTSTAVGILLGRFVPDTWGLDFALPLTFIALVVPSLRHAADRLTAVVAGGMAVLLVGLPYKLGLILASLVAIGVGLVWERRR
ncbi:AzlC family ABC transporter permease [uncultured Thermanaerothrix sp.]|uniref:AzlC family ABC transporter permease n=1 Tax=uncultured Thermanaerothrix sp. TaxID=1195149 RepID=UPI00262A7632|nr:AzlC family ABC transporter permease [uncultured Thermanaerothrix sp.]